MSFSVERQPMILFETGASQLALPARGKGSSAGENTTIIQQFSFPGDLRSIPDSREQILQYVRQHCAGQSEADEIDLTIALQEALANAALHGCSDDSSKRICCSVQVEPAKVSFVICDPGQGFDYERISDPNRFESSTAEHGRGIALMRSVVDDISFHQGGTEVRFSKRLTC
jgi:serine/threonine-protein kinase RsbW